MNYAHSEALKELRAGAANVGLTFKRSNVKLNGVYLWNLVERENGNVLISNYSFWSAYNDFCSGYISSWNGSKFEGIEK